MTTSELGVIGAQRARAEEKHREQQAEEYEEAKPKPEHPIAKTKAAWDSDTALRLQALRIAQEVPDAGTLLPEEVIARATAYIAFIKGESSV